MRHSRVFLRSWGVTRKFCSLSFYSDTHWPAKSRYIKLAARSPVGPRSVTPTNWLYGSNGLKQLALNIKNAELQCYQTACAARFPTVFETGLKLANPMEWLALEDNVARHCRAVAVKVTVPINDLSIGR
jgi:hypothetical protein